MSRNEIFDLLEINDPEDNFNPNEKGQNWVKHFLIRVISIVFIIGAIIIISEIQNLGMNDNLAILLGCILIFFIWLLFIIIEAIILQVRKKTILRNTNLAIIGLAIMLFLLFSSIIS